MASVLTNRIDVKLIESSKPQTQKQILYILKKDDKCMYSVIAKC